jgi:hypothetical protein
MITIVNNSPILGEIIRSTSDPPGDVNAAAPLPVVQLPESSKILHRLHTFIFPVTPLVPSTSEEIMELLSVAQKYQMDSALTRIRDTIARHHPLPTRLEPALRIYALAQKYGLRPEALQIARTILDYPMTIEDLDNMFDIMPGASLYELWKYHKRVWTVLSSDLAEFRMTYARRAMGGLQCTELSFSQIPSWLDQYIESIGKAPNKFDPGELNIAMARHIRDKDNDLRCRCASVSSQTMRNFREALATVVHRSFEKVRMVDVKSAT